MDRYSLIESKLQREMLLLQGLGCRWKGCSFCDYHHDVSQDPYQMNASVLERVCGKYGVLDIINSGSAMELDTHSIEHIKDVVRERKIHTLWFEAHYMYRHRLSEFAQMFSPAEVKFRCGVETFDGRLRKSWNKGINEDVTAKDVARYFQGVCLLCCVEGQTKAQIMDDLAKAEELLSIIASICFAIIQLLCVGIMLLHVGLRLRYILCWRRIPRWKFY